MSKRVEDRVWRLLDYTETRRMLAVLLGLLLGIGALATFALPVLILSLGLTGLAAGLLLAVEATLCGVWLWVWSR